MTVRLAPQIRAMLKSVYRALSRSGSRITNRLPGACRVKTRGWGNAVSLSGVSRLRRSAISIEGHDNSVDLGSSELINECRISVTGNRNRIVVTRARAHAMGIVIRGNDNLISIGDGCVIHGLGLVCEDSGNSISIGGTTEIAGGTEMATMEGTEIVVGERCLFSSGIHLRTGDSHSVVNLAGERINPSRNIIIGNHVWIGMGVTILKGSAVADSSILAAHAVLTKRFDSPNCTIAGNPARVVREGVDWKVERISPTQVLPVEPQREV